METAFSMIVRAEIFPFSLLFFGLCSVSDPSTGCRWLTMGVRGRRGGQGQVMGVWWGLTKYTNIGGQRQQQQQQ